MPERIWSDSPWEAEVGYCRAVRRGQIIAVSGTAPVDAHGKTVAPGDAYAQTVRCLEVARAALEGLGGSLRQVVRTRLFVTDISRWRDYGRAHGEVFRDFPPATTMVEVRALIAPDMLVGLELDAIVD